MELYNAEEAADMILNMSIIESEGDGEHSDIVSDVDENTDLVKNMIGLKE